jgi:hypothetical protein
MLENFHFKIKGETVITLKCILVSGFVGWMEVTRNLI